MDNNEGDEAISAFINILDYNSVILSNELLTDLIYSNKVLVKDAVFVELVEKIKNNKEKGFSYNLALYAFHSFNKNSTLASLYLNRILDCDKYEGIVKDASFIVDLLKRLDGSNLTEEDVKLKNVIIAKESCRKSFDKCYNEIIEKLIVPPQENKNEEIKIESESSKEENPIETIKS